MSGEKIKSVNIGFTLTRWPEAHLHMNVALCVRFVNKEPFANTVVHFSKPAFY